MNKYWKIILPILILVHLYLLSKLLFTAWPEMLLWPYLMVKGWLPYTNIAIAHTPHLLMDLTLYYKVFGTGIFQLKAFTWTLIILTDLVVVWVSNKLWNKKVAAITLFSFVVWQLFFDGNGLWFDLMVVPLSVLAFYFISKGKYFLAGFFWATAFFTKQTAVWFLVPILVDIYRTRKQNSQYFSSFVLGSVCLFIGAFLLLWIWGVLPDFYGWAINFGIFILPRSQGQIQLPDFKALIIASFPFLAFLPLLFDKKNRNLRLVIWALAGSLGTYPRFEYFHFQPAVPYLAMATGLMGGKLKSKGLMKIFTPVYIFGAIYLFGGFFMRNYGEGVRFYDQNVIDITSYIKNKTQPNDKIFVMNWWDNIYALTNTVPAVNPWVPQLSWYQDLPGVQNKEILDLERSKPKMILLQPYSESGLASYIPQKLYDYVLKNYKQKEIIDGIQILVAMHQ